MITKKYELLCLSGGLFLLIVCLGVWDILGSTILGEYTGIWQIFLLGLSGGYFHSAILVGDKK